MKFENTEVWGFEHAIRGMRKGYRKTRSKSFTEWVESLPYAEELIMLKGKGK